MILVNLSILEKNIFFYLDPDKTKVYILWVKSW